MHYDIHCNEYLSHSLCSYSERSVFCFFDATDVAVFDGEPLLTTTCPNLRFAWVHGPQKDLTFRARPLQPNMLP